jgi:predicted DNA-binding protein (MmcQ/YjbR family)
MPMTTPDHLLAPVRQLVQRLPGSEEVVEGSVGDPVWKVRGKIFVMQHPHQERPSLWMKAPPGIQDALIAQAPGVWFRPPYVGNRGWVGAWLDDDTPWPDLLDQIEESWEMTASKAQLRERDAALERGKA